MDRVQEASNVITKINKFKNNEITEASLITSICNYFDLIKSQNLTPSDMKFLKYISNTIGIPHYYDLLINKFKETSSEYNNFSLNTIASLIYESTLYIDENIKLHKYQKSILDMYESSEQKRIFLSASTSFGKTYLVYEIIKKMKYKNIVLMFPTIALLSENLERLKTGEYYHYFRNNYKIHTLSQIEDDEIAENNIFIYTPERYLSFLDKNSDLHFDYIFMDEIYKIDNEYIIDNQEAKENERDIAYRVALYNALKNNADMLLVGPYIEFSDSTKEGYNPSFSNFLQTNNFSLVNFNEYEIVNKTRSNLEDIEHLNIRKNIPKKDKLKSIFSYLMRKNENCIVYCSGSATAESKAREIISEIESIENNETLANLINHIKLSFNSEWIVVKALEKGIGIHHGLVPKYMQKEIINLFNEGILKGLFSTTTITEGVNTSAKNLIVFNHKKGKKDLKKFDAKNIEGRAGRFMHHYSGEVFVLEPKFNEIINSNETGINHKNYDEHSIKDQIDYFITDDKYLNNSDIVEKIELLNQISQRGIPIEIFNSYKVISYSDKIKLYDKISDLTYSEHQQIKKLISAINSNTLKVDFDGLDMVVYLLISIVKNNDLHNLIKMKKRSPVNNKEHSVITFLLHAYLTHGFKGLLDYKINTQNMIVDKAMRESSKFVYNILKYQLVKYLGVFNTFYKFVRAKRENKEDVVGIDKLLSKLEHNAFTKTGKLAADYGVPYKIVQYYDNLDINSMEANDIRLKFDEYEKESFLRFEKIIK